MRIAPAIVLSEPQRVQLTGYARGRKVPLRVSQRAKILLLASDGKQNEEIARALATSPPTVARWRLRFIQQGVAGIETDAPRPGRNPRSAGGSLHPRCRLGFRQLAHTRSSDSRASPVRRR